MMTGLYIHIPFCNNKCAYCGFYSETSKKHLTKDYINALLKDIKTYQNKKFDTIYIGGGTPSSIDIHLLEYLVENILKNIQFSNKEFTIEANPESVNSNFLSFIKDYPLNRISLGIQSLDDNVLKKLTRIHSSKDAFNAAINIKNTGKDLNIDMIYDIKGIDNNIIFNTINKFLEIDPAHISAYAYDHKDTGFLEGFNEDNSLFEDVENILESNGYYKYEVSNFAKTGKESIHNTLYWTSCEYIGIGAAAHSMTYLDNGYRKRSAKIQNIEKYIANPYTNELEETINIEDIVVEDVLLGLRMKKGANINRIENLFCSLPEKFHENINKYINLGLLEKSGNYLKTTKKGASLLESLSASLINY